MVRGRKGNVSTLFLGLIVFGAIIFNSLVIIERKTASIKRQNIHNAVVAANLAAYKAIDQGDKATVLSIRPDILQGYMTNPDSILNSYNLNQIVNMMTSEYFPPGQRYKAIYINREEAYTYFCDYMNKNIGLTPTTADRYKLISINHNTNKGDVNEMKINSFEIYNAIYKDMTKVTVPSNIKSENRTYSGIHIDITSKVNNAVRFQSLGNESTVPIHIDTDVTLYRPTIK